MDETPRTEASTSPTPRHRRWRRLLWSVSLAGLLCVLGTALALDIYGSSEHAKPADVIIVLGARVLPGGVAGDSLSARTRKGADLFRRGFAKHMIFTGGVGDYGPAESVVAERMAHDLGVPSTATHTEQRSTSTRENIRYAITLCRENGWRTAIVVSDPYHLWRARYFLRCEGMTVYPSPALDCIRHRNLSMRITWTLRETLLVYRELLMDALHLSR